MGDAEACGVIYSLTVFDLIYQSADYKPSISIRRDFYSKQDKIESYYNDYYEYRVGDLPYSIYIKDDSLLMGNGTYLPVVMFGSKSNSYLYLHNGKIARFIDVQKSDTIDFIN